MATTLGKTLVDLETKFWQSMVDQNTDTTVAKLGEPAIMVSPHGAIKFDHAGYRQMAEHGSMVVTSFELRDVDVLFPSEDTAILTYRVKQVVASRDQGQRSEQDMNDTSTWVRDGQRWLCVMHTETPVAARPAAH